MWRSGALAFLLAIAGQAQQGNDRFAAISLYDGNWTMSVHDGEKTHVDHLANRCSQNGDFYTCQQTLNGNVSALVVFVFAGRHHYFVNNILPEGWATGRTELTITGSHWIYETKDVENGHTTWYRTTNDFNGATTIHFESQQSSDDRLWQTTRSGDETREQ